MLQPHALRTIAIDFDGTLIDIHEPWAKEYVLASGHVGFSAASILNWDYSKYLLPGWADRYARLRTPALYLRTRPLPGAVAAIRQLADQGHRLICVTHDTMAFAEVKRVQLARFFPSIRSLVLAEKKDCVDWDVLIDDGLHNKPTNLVPQPWNSPPNGETWATRHERFWRELPGKLACC